MKWNLLRFKDNLLEFNQLLALTKSLLIIPLRRVRLLYERYRQLSSANEAM